MKCLLLLVLGVAMPVHAQSKPVEKWEYARFLSIVYPDMNENDMWFAGDSVVESIGISSLGAKLGAPPGNQAVLFNWIGRQGWELVTCTSGRTPAAGGTTSECWFKRRRLN